MAGHYKQTGRYHRRPITSDRLAKVRAAMGSREDDEYWNVKYAEASCHEHGGDWMYFDAPSGEWVCIECETEDDLNRTYKYG